MIVWKRRIAGMTRAVLWAILRKAELKYFRRECHDVNVIWGLGEIKSESRGADC